MSHANRVTTGTQINSDNPGVLFYYTAVIAPSSSFTIILAQTNNSTVNAKFPALSVQQGDQINLYDANCNTSRLQGATTVTVNSATQQQTIAIAVNGATAGQVFYVGTKYTPKNLVGFTVPTPHPTVTYTFVTSLKNSPPIPTSQASVPLVPTS